VTLPSLEAKAKNPLHDPVIKAGYDALKRGKSKRDYVEIIITRPFQWAPSWRAKKTLFFFPNDEPQCLAWEGAAIAIRMGHAVPVSAESKAMSE